MKDNDKTKEQLTNEPPQIRRRGAERKAQVIRGRVTWLFITGMFILLCILLGLNEILDLPHLVLSAPHTSINWHEIIIETVMIGGIGLFLVLSFTRSITRRKEAEELYITLAESSQAGVYIVQDGKFRFINHDAAAYAGYSKEEALGIGSIHIVHPDDRKKAKENAVKMLKGESSSPYEFRIITRGGETRWILETVTPILYRGKHAILGNSMDITDLKRVSNQLEESEQKLSQIVEGSSVPTFVINSDHIVTHWNMACETMTDTSANEVIGTQNQRMAFYPLEGRPVLADFIVDEASEEEIARHCGINYQKSVLIEGAYETEGFFSHMGDSGKWLFFTAAPLKNHEGKVIGAIETLQDITKSRLAEEALRKSEGKYRTLVETTLDLVFTVDRRGMYTYINPRFEGVTGYTASELTGRPFTHIVAPEQIESTVDRFKEGISGKLIAPYEAKLLHKNGERILVEFLVTTSYDTDGNPSGRFGVGRDITDRKRAEEALRQAEREKTLILDNISELVFYIAPDYKVLWASDAAYKFFNMLPDQLVGKRCYEALHNRNELCSVCPVANTFKTGVKTEIENVSSYGRSWVLRGYPVRDESGNVIGVVEVATDITDRKRAEEKLKENEERLNLALEVTSDALWDRNIETGEMYFSPRYYTMLGYEPYEMPPSYDTWTDLLHSDDRKHTINKVNKHIKGKSNSYDVEFRLRSKSGKWRWIRSRGKVVERNAGGSALRMVGTHVDITERKYAADKIKTSLREKEVLLREVHHRVKNNMQVISSLLNLQAGYIKDAEALEMFKDCQNRVRSMALMHEKLYQSRNLASIDFSKYIRSLTNDLLRLYSVNTNAIKLKVDAGDALLDINTAIPCGLIINELISNSLKHAFPDSRNGKISIKLLSDNDNKYTLVVSDNGIGLPENLDFRNTESLGLQLVNTLTDQLHGTIEVDGSGGTSVKIIFREQTTSDKLVKNQKSSHSRGSGSPQAVEKTGFPLPRE